MQAGKFLKANYLQLAVSDSECAVMRVRCYVCAVACLMQASLAALRSEYDASQASLFELMAAQEAAAGSASTAEQLATEEVERLNSELTQARKERVLLQRQLQHYEQRQQQQEAGALNEQRQAGASTADDGSGDTIDQQQQLQPSALQHKSAAVAALQAELEAGQEAARDQHHEVQDWACLLLVCRELCLLLFTLYMSSSWHAGLPGSPVL